VWFVSEYSLAPLLTQDIHIKRLFVPQLIATGRCRVIWEENYITSCYVFIGYNFPDDVVNLLGIQMSNYFLLSINSDWVCVCIIHVCIHVSEHTHTQNDLKEKLRGC